MQSVLNGRNFRYHFGVGRFHILPKSYKISHSLCLNNFLQVWLIGSQSYQVPPFRYINWDDETYHLVRGRKVIGMMKYSMRSVKWAAEAVGICTEDNWDVKRVNLLYTMVSGRFNFKRNKRFDSLSWSSFVRDLYTRRGYIIGELNEEQVQAWQGQKKKT